MVFAFTVTTMLARAQDLGVIGPVYPIAEPNLLEVILGRLRAADEDGTLARLQRESLARVRRDVEDPAPVAGLSRTRQPRRFHHDPSIVVQEAIRDAEADGSSCRPARWSIRSTRCRSARRCSSSTRAIASRSRCARKLIDERQGKVKVILTGGSYLDLTPLAAAGVLRPAGHAHDEARHPSGARARHPGRQEAAHR